MNVLVDTSVWSLALRRRPENLNHRETRLVNELAEIIRDGRARILGPIRQELLSGIREPAHFERLRGNLRAFPDELLVMADFEMAAHAVNQCRSEGIAVSPVDALICATTTARGWGVFTTDPDFSRYARILPLQMHALRT